ncbi:MAG: hypothetical protein IJ364_06835 [Oscillospiraceae bacterium]|nr:hypothetical protein [Oscillospiraceae bacterium]
MKKTVLTRLSVIIALVAALYLLTGCGECQHQWGEADCLNPSTCSECGAVQGEALGHDWAAATCTAPESCSRCGETQGELAGHDWLPASCENPEHCSRCSETKGEALGHSYGKWLLDVTEMYRICSGCQQTEKAEIDYALYLEQHIYGRWNLCSMIKNGRYLDSYWLSQSEADPEYCFYEDGRVTSMGFEEKEISPSWSFDHGEYDSANYCHKIYISFPNSNELSSACFNCIGEDITYDVPLDDDGDVATLSNSFGDEVGKALVGTWSAWSQGSIYNISFSEDRSFTADIDGEISGFWQPRQPGVYSDGRSSDVHIMLSYLKDGKEYSKFTTLNSFYKGMSQKQMSNYLSFAMDVNDTYTHFGLDVQQFLTDALSTADSAHLGNWTSIDYIVSTPNYETYSSDEERGLSTEYSIVFNDDGSFSAKLNRELEGTWSLREIRRENDGVCLMYNLTAPGISDYSYFQRYEDGDGYVYVSYTDNVSANYSFKQMDEEEIAQRNELVANAPSKIVGEWFNTVDGFNAVFNEDGTFSISSDTNPEQYGSEGYWHFNTISEFQGTYTYIYDLETIFEIEIEEGAEASEGADLTGAINNAVDAMGDTESAEEEPMTYREDYALRLTINEGMWKLEMDSFYGSGTLYNAEGLAMVDEANAAIVGKWTASTATEYNTDTGEAKDVSVDSYLEVAEGGSFTGYAGQNIQGYIEFYDTDEGARRYLVHFSEGPYSEAMFTLNGEYFSANVRPYLIDFTK